MADIILENVNKSYQNKAVLSSLSLRLAEGGIYGIMAPSGYGKTTLLRLLAGLESADSGEIRGLPSHCSMVFQEDRLCEEADAVKNARLGRRNATREEAEALLVRLGLDGHTAKRVSELSGGMRRRVSIARALLSDAPLLLLDEPFKGLDEELRAKVIAEMRPYLVGRTVVLVTHDAEEAEAMGAEILSLSALAEG